MSKGSVLLVDDDESIVQVFKLILEDEGYTIQTANSGKAAAEIMAQSNFDVAILDFKLPDLPGVELARMIRMHDTRIRIIFLSGYDIDRNQLAELDISKIFLKPVSPELLIRNIEESMA
jgi:DNA-binding response OmpR family regulator